MRRSRGMLCMALAGALISFVPSVAHAQSDATVRGRVTDEEGSGIPGVQVIVTNQNTGSQGGAVTQSDGSFTVAGLRTGEPHVVVARTIGYGPQMRDGVVLSPGEARALDLTLPREAIALDAVEVLATRAVERQTPVAFTDVDKVQIQQQLGSRDLPMVLNTTPSVYATMQGGGSGDARINIRGFDQRNTAVMINGVPVNDMENGWVYWSNWDGLGDAASSIQVQRGLAAVNLATPSIGGTLNVITDPTAIAPGLGYKQEFGSRGFLKETLTASTGNVGRFAFTGNVVRKQGDGFFSTNGALATWTDAWAYYGAAAFVINDRHRLELYAVGAPQSHGQNLYKLNPAQIDHGFAREIGVSDAAIAEIAEAGRFWSPNVNTVSRSYQETQYASIGPKKGTFSRFGDDYINERENYFHKPQVNLNYYARLADGLTWSTVAYYSGGKGGGSGTLGSLAWDYTYRQRVADWDATIAENRANGPSLGILRSSVNNQWTLGAISKLRREFAGDITAEVGVDWRTASIDHYRDVRDLLGGQYWVDEANDFTGPRNATYGDKINYFNTNDVDWLGGHIQAERATAAGSIYAMAGLVQSSYHYTDHFARDPATGGELVLESGNLHGYQVKGGLGRNLTPEWSVFGNAGYVSKVPIFDQAIDDFNGEVLTNPKNERFLSFEIGTSYASLDRRLSADLNLYHTTWNDRSFTFYIPVDDIYAQILGVDQQHLGVELHAGYQPLDILRFDGSASVGRWEYVSDASGRAVAGDRTSSTQYSYYIDGLKVSDQPQTQFSYALSVFPLEGLWMQFLGRTNYNYYAAFDPFGRTDPSDRAQSWKAPGYTVFDLHGAYRITDLIPFWQGGDVRVFVNVFNVLDELYVQDATDNSRYNAFYQCAPERTTRPCAADPGHDAEASEVFLGLPRYFNLGFEVRF